jgi:hypothetical protein
VILGRAILKKVVVVVFVVVRKEVVKSLRAGDNRM